MNTFCFYLIGDEYNQITYVVANDPKLWIRKKKTTYLISPILHAGW